MSGNGFRRRGFGPRVLHSNGPGGGFGGGFGGPRFPRPNFAHSRPPSNRPPRPENWVGRGGRPTVFPPWQQNVNYAQRPLFRGNTACRPNVRGGPLYARGTCRFSGPGRPPVPHIVGGPPNIAKPRMVFSQDQHSQDKANAQPQIPPLGSEEERQRKITETVDRLKLKLSSITKEEITDFWEDDLSALPPSVPDDNTELKKGIPELRHEPPELNLTFNDFRDIGRVDSDNAKSESTENIDESIDPTINNYNDNIGANTDASEDTQNKYIAYDKDVNEFGGNVEIREQNKLLGDSEALLLHQDRAEQEEHNSSKSEHNVEQANLLSEEIDQNASINTNSRLMDLSSISDKIELEQVHGNQCLNDKAVNPEDSHADVLQSQENLQAMQTQDRNIIELDRCSINKNSIVHSQETCNITQTRILMEESAQTSTNADDSMLSCSTPCDYANFKQKVQTSLAITTISQSNVSDIHTLNSVTESKFLNVQRLGDFTHLETKTFTEPTRSADLSTHGDRQPFGNQLVSPVPSEPIDVVFDPCTPPPCSHIKGVSFHDSRVQIPSSFLSQDVLPNVDFTEPPPNMQTEPRSDAKITLDPLDPVPLSVVQNQSQLPLTSQNTMHPTRLMPAFDPKEPPPLLRTRNKLKNLPGFNPQQPPPIIPCHTEVLQPPPAFDPRLSSQQRSHLMVQTSLETCVPSVIQTNNMEPLQIPDFSANLAASVNFTQLPPMNIPPPQPFIPNIQTNFQLSVPHTSVLSRIEHGFTAPPPPPVYLSEIPTPPPVQPLNDIDNEEQNVNMDDGLDDMLNAMEFAKQVMNMTAETKNNESTANSVLEESSIVQSEVSEQNIHTVTSLQSNITALTKKKARHQDKKDESKINEQAVTSKNDNQKDNGSTKTEQSVQYPKLNTTKVPLMNEQRRPKVMFNLNSKSRMINQREEWHSRNEIAKTKKQKSVSSTETSKTYRKPIFRERKTTNKRSLDQKRNSASKTTIRQPAIKVNKDDEHQKEIDRIFATATFHAQHSIPNIVASINVTAGNNEPNKKQTKDGTSPPLETSWKSRVINRFLKMSKNDICNMVNNSSLRKFDIAMKHLVKEKRSSLSLQMRNTENEKIKEYDRTEFMNQLNAMLDPGATVDMSDLPTEFIHHLSEVLQLDPMPLGTTNTPPNPEVVHKDAQDYNKEDGLSTPCLLDNIKEEISDNELRIGHDSDSNELDHMSNKSGTCILESECLVQSELLDRDMPGDAVKSEQQSACSDQRQLFNVCNLDDLFSVVSEQAKNICTPPEHTTNNLMDKDDSCPLANTGLRNITGGSTLSQHSEQRMQEFDEIFLNTVVKEKLDSNKNATISSNINSHKVNGIEAGNVRRRKSSSEDRNMFRLQKYESWSRRKPEDLDAFRNLTKEEWEAKYGKSTNQSGSNSSDNMINRERDKSNTHRRVYPSDSSTTHSSPLQRESTTNTRKKIHTKYELRTKEQDTKSFTSESESSTSSTSEGSTYETAPEVSKLLKVIKEKEKIAKIRSLNETIRDEVTAEIERKWKQKSKNRERKSRKRERKRQERKMKRKRIRKKKKKKLFRSSAECFDEEIAKKDRILMEDEIKKEVIIKEEPDFPEESVTYNSMEAATMLDNAQTIESNYDFENTAACARIEKSQVPVESSPLQQLQSQNKDVITGMALQQKTKAQLKQLPPSPDMERTQSVRDFNRISIQSEQTTIEKHSKNTKGNIENSSSHRPSDKDRTQCKDNLNSVDKNLLTMSNTPAHIVPVTCKEDNADRYDPTLPLFNVSEINDVLNIHTDRHTNDNSQSTSIAHVLYKENSVDRFKPILPSFIPPGINDNHQSTSTIQISNEENSGHCYKPTLPLFIPPATNDVFSESTNQHINDNKQYSTNTSRPESTGNKRGLKKIDIKAYKARALQRKIKEQSQLQETTKNISLPPNNVPSTSILSNASVTEQESASAQNRNIPINSNLNTMQSNPESLPLISLVATSKLLSETSPDSISLNKAEKHIDKTKTNETLHAASKHVENDLDKTITHGDKNIELASSTDKAKSVPQPTIEKEFQPDQSAMSEKTVTSTDYEALKFKNIRSEGIKELKLKKERGKRQKEKKATLEHITDRILSKRKRLSVENISADVKNEFPSTASSADDRPGTIPNIFKLGSTDNEMGNTSFSDSCSVARNLSRLERDATEGETIIYPKVVERNNDSELKGLSQSSKQDIAVSQSQQLTSITKNNETVAVDLDPVVERTDIEKMNKLACAFANNEYHKTNMDVSYTEATPGNHAEEIEKVQKKNNNSEPQMLHAVKYAEGTIQNSTGKINVRENEALRHAMDYHNNDEKIDVTLKTEVNKNVDTVVRSLTESLTFTAGNRLSPVEQILSVSSGQVPSNEHEEDPDKNLIHLHHHVMHDDKCKKTSDQAIGNYAEKDEVEQEYTKSKTTNSEIPLNKDVKCSELDETNVSSPDSLDIPFKGFIPENLPVQSMYEDSNRSCLNNENVTIEENNICQENNRRKSCLPITSKKSKPDPKLWSISCEGEVQEMPALQQDSAKDQDGNLDSVDSLINADSTNISVEHNAEVDKQNLCSVAVEKHYAQRSIYPLEEVSQNMLKVQMGNVGEQITLNKVDESKQDVCNNKYTSFTPLDEYTSIDEISRLDEQIDIHNLESEISARYYVGTNKACENKILHSMTTVSDSCMPQTSRDSENNDSSSKLLQQEVSTADKMDSQAVISETSLQGIEYSSCAMPLQTESNTFCVEQRLTTLNTLHRETNSSVAIESTADQILGSLSELLINIKAQEQGVMLTDSMSDTIFNKSCTGSPHEIERPEGINTWDDKNSHKSTENVFTSVLISPEKISNTLNVPKQLNIPTKAALKESTENSLHTMNLEAHVHIANTQLSDAKSKATLNTSTQDLPIPLSCTSKETNKASLEKSLGESPANSIALTPTYETLMEPSAQYSIGEISCENVDDNVSTNSEKNNDLNCASYYDQAPVNNKGKKNVSISTSKKSKRIHSSNILHTTKNATKIKRKRTDRLKFFKKQGKIAVDSDIVQMTSNPNTRESIMARMIAIDLEIHKLMTEKMTLYQMLESETSFSNNTSLSSGITDKNKEKVTSNRPDTPSALMSQLMQNLDNSLTMPSPLSAKTRVDSVSARKSLSSEEHKLHKQDGDDDEISSCSSNIRSSMSSRKKKQKSMSVAKCKKSEDNYSMQKTCMEKQQKSDATKITSKKAENDILQGNPNKDVPISVSKTPIDTSEREKQLAVSNKCDTISDLQFQHNFHMEINHTSVPVFKRSENVDVEKGGLVDSLHEEYTPGKNGSNFMSKMLEKRSENNTTVKEGGDYSNNRNQEAETLNKKKTLHTVCTVDKSPDDSPEKLSIYSDDSTWEAYIQNSIVGAHDRKKLNTGLALLEEAYRRETEKSRKLRTKARREQKERVRCLLRSVNSLTPEEEELPLSVLYVKKLQQKRDLLEALGDKTEIFSCNEDPKTWEHVVEVINAVAENRVQDLYKSNPDAKPADVSQPDNQRVSPDSSSLPSIKDDLSHVKYGVQDSILAKSKPIDIISFSDLQKKILTSAKSKMSDSNSEVGVTLESVEDRRKLARISTHAMCYETNVEESISSDLCRDDKPGTMDFSRAKTELASISSVIQSDITGLKESLICGSQRLQVNEENNNLNTIRKDVEGGNITESYGTSNLSCNRTRDKNLLSFGSTLENIERTLEDERIQKSVISKITTDGEACSNIHKDCNKNTVKIMDSKTTLLKPIAKQVSHWVKSDEQDKSCKQIEGSSYNTISVAHKEKTLLINTNEFEDNNSLVSDTPKCMPDTVQSTDMDEIVRAQEKKEKSKEPTNQMIKVKYDHSVTANVENIFEDINDPRNKVYGRKRLTSGSSSSKTSRYSENSSKRTKLSHTNLNDPSLEHSLPVKDNNLERHRVNKTSTFATLDNEESENMLGNTKRSRKLKKSFSTIDGKCKVTEAGVLSTDRCRTHENVRRFAKSTERSMTKDEAVHLTCKRKQHTRQEMMNCKVKLIDSKYTILRPDVSLNVLRRLGISSINICSRQKTVQPKGEVDKVQETRVIDEMETISNAKGHFLDVVAIPQSARLDLNQDYKTTTGSSVNQDCALLKTKRVSKISMSSNEHNVHSEPDINITLMQTKQGEPETFDILRDDTRLEVEVIEEKDVARNPNIDEVKLISEMTEIEDVESTYSRTEYVAHKGPILDIQVFGNSFLAASEDGTIYRYSQMSNIVLNTYKGHKSAITCLYIHKTGCTDHTKERLYSGSLDGTLRSYNIITGAQTNSTVDVGSPIQCMDQAWGMIFIGTKSGQVSRFHMKSSSIKGSSIQFSDKSVLALKATSEGSRRVLIVASRSQPITIRDAQSGLFLRSISGDKSHTVYSLMRDNSLIYCGTSGTSIPVFDFTSGEQVMQYDAGVGIVCMRLFKQLLFAGCYDGNIYVFNTKDHNLVCSIPGPGNMLLSMEIVNDKIIAGSKDRQLQMWHMPRQVCILLGGKT